VQVEKEWKRKCDGKYQKFGMFELEEMAKKGQVFYWLFAEQ